MCYNFFYLKGIQKINVRSK